MASRVSLSVCSFPACLKTVELRFAFRSHNSNFIVRYPSRSALYYSRPCVSELIPASIWPTSKDRAGPFAIVLCWQAGIEVLRLSAWKAAESPWKDFCPAEQIVSSHKYAACQPPARQGRGVLLGKARSAWLMTPTPYSTATIRRPKSPRRSGSGDPTCSLPTRRGVGHARRQPPR